MQISSQFPILFTYHWHTIRRLMDLAARLSDEEFRSNPGYGHGSLHDLFFHLLRTDASWRVALESGRQQAGLRAEDFPDLPSLRTLLAEEQRAWQTLLDRLGEEGIAGEAQLTDRRGVAFPIPRWRVLQHLALHGMQHQTEIAQLLTAKGQPPGDIDFIFFQES